MTRNRSHVPRLEVARGDLTEARDVIILAHGGQEHSYEVPTALRPPLLRMWPLARSAARAAPGACVALVRYRYRGWNGDDADARTDVRTLLDRLPGTVQRVSLVGHSMGGRAVLANADDDRVVGILGLAPWLPDDEPLVRPAGPVVVTAHGTDDTVTAPRGTSRYVRRLRDTGRSVAEFAVQGDGHAMLHRHRDWSELVRRYVGTCLSSADPFVESALTTGADSGAVALPRWHARSGRARGVLDIGRARLALR